MVRITLNDNQVMRRLLDRARDLSPVRKLIALLGVRGVQRNFDRETAPDGTRWKPLKYRVGHILVDTSLMRNGITSDSPDATTVRIGAGAATKYKNAIHNFGGQAGRGHKTTIPERRYMGLSDADRQQLVKEVKAQVLRQLKGGHA